MNEHNDGVYFEFGHDVAEAVEPEFNFDDLETPEMLFVGDYGVSLNMALAHEPNSALESHPSLVITAIHEDNYAANDLFVMAQ